MNNDIRAFQSPSLPCNALPFLKSIATVVRDQGTGAISSDCSKAMLWVLMAQAYGQLAVIDMTEEWKRLDHVFGATNNV